MTKIDHKSSQFLEPLFEYSAPATAAARRRTLKMLTQLFGDRLLIANATGCSSIYGGNLPTTAVHDERDGRGPAWSELAVRGQRRVRLRLPDRARRPRRRLRALSSSTWPRRSATARPRAARRRSVERGGIAAQRERVVALRRQLAP
jgi:pyruvate-ferredoxin/flavodoxin oxidoreductase